MISGGALFSHFKKDFFIVKRWINGGTDFGLIWIIKRSVSYTHLDVYKRQGVGLAIKEAGKVGEIIHVGLDDLDQLIVLIKEGVVESSYSTKPKMQGAYAVLCMWLQNQGIATPMLVDTGFVVITKDMIPDDVKEYKGY